MVLKNKLKKGFMGASILAVLGASLVVGVSANDSPKTVTNDVNLEIMSGGFDLTTSPIANFADITLKEGPETYTTSFNEKFTVQDLRGTHAGWALKVQADAFASDSHTLPQGSLTLAGVQNVERVGNGSATVPSVTHSGVTAIDTSDALLVAEAKAGDEGAGIFDITFAPNALELTVDPTTAKVGSYQTTLTWNLESTPSAG